MCIYKSYIIYTTVLHHTYSISHHDILWPPWKIHDIPPPELTRWLAPENGGVGSERRQGIGLLKRPLAETGKRRARGIRWNLFV